MQKNSLFDDPIYLQAREARLKNLFAHVDPGTLAGKRILELGCGTGDLGQAFVQWGSQVVSVDARPEHIVLLRERYPQREAHVADLEQWDFSCLGPFDAILCFGVLYHLATPEDFLARCAQNAATLYLETIVADFDEAIVARCEEDGASPGSDQSYSGRGCRPSPSWITCTLNRCGFSVRDISSVLANWGGEYPSAFDWAPQNRGEWRRGNTNLRKMFICHRQT